MRNIDMFDDGSNDDSNMKTNKEKFLKLVSDEKVDTVERNKERIKNRDMTRLSQSIALKVLNRLDVLNWSNEEFADEMGITLDEVKKIISGKTNLTLDVIAKIQKVLNISILQTKPFDQISSDLNPVIKDYAKIPFDEFLKYYKLKLELKKYIIIRDGQLLMNYLSAVWLEEYKRITNTEFDCYYNDKLIDNTLKHLEKIWKTK